MVGAKGVGRFVKITTVDLLATYNDPAPSTILLGPKIDQRLTRFEGRRFGRMHCGLFFSVPRSHRRTIANGTSVALTVHRELPIVVSFQKRSRRMTSILLGNEGIPCAIGSRRVIVSAERITGKRGHIAVRFATGSRSLGHQSRFLCALLIPSQTHALFPYFSRPSVGSLFALSLRIPSS